MLTNVELGTYLKNVREDKKISLRDVEKLTGIGYSHLSMIENGKRNVTPALLKNLAKIYMVDYIDLYEKAGYLDLIESEKLKTAIPSSAVVFVYGTIPAGVPMEMIEDIIDTEEIPADMLKGGKQYFGLKIKGDSMYPEYRDGDVIICEKIEDCENGDECVVMVNGDDGTFKKVLKSENGIILQPLNTTYEPMVYTNEQVEKLPVKIIGKVVELRRKK